MRPGQDCPRDSWFVAAARRRGELTATRRSFFFAPFAHGAFSFLKFLLLFVITSLIRAPARLWRELGQGFGYVFCSLLFPSSFGIVAVPMFRLPKGILKYAIGWALVLGVRLLPFRAPNIEPVMTTLMPFSKRYGLAGAFVFGFLSMVLYDVATREIGIWTLVTALAYGAIGIASAFFFRNRESTAVNYLKFSIMGTIVFDALTGLTIGPIFYAQPFMVAFLGQIPFTLLHLLGNSIFAVLVSPLIYRWVVANPKLEMSSVARALDPSRV